MDHRKIPTLVMEHCLCDGCKNKLNKLNDKIPQVHSIKFYTEQGKATISGAVDPARVMEELAKEGIKPKILWEKSSPINSYHQQKQIVLQKHSLREQVHRSGSRVHCSEQVCQSRSRVGPSGSKSRSRVSRSESRSRVSQSGSRSRSESRSRISRNESRSKSLSRSRVNRNESRSRSLSRSRSRVSRNGSQNRSLNRVSRNGSGSRSLSGSRVSRNESRSRSLNRNRSRVSRNGSGSRSLSRSRVSRNKSRSRSLSRNRSRVSRNGSRSRSLSRSKVHRNGSPYRSLSRSKSRVSRNEGRSRNLSRSRSRVSQNGRQSQSLCRSKVHRNGSRSRSLSRSKSRVSRSGSGVHRKQVHHVLLHREQVHLISREQVRRLPLVQEQAPHELRKPAEFADCYLNHKHKLKKVRRSNKRYSCDGCKEDGFKSRYRCEPCNFDLHYECRFPKLTISPEINEELVFEFRPQPPMGKLCDACGKDIHGCFYNCKAKGMDLHPCCARLKARVSNCDMVLVLCKKVSWECLWCRKKVRPGTERGIPGWCYVSECKKYNIHIHCITQMWHQAWQRGLMDGAGENSIGNINFEHMTISDGNRGGRGTKVALKIIGILRIVVGILLGDPSVFFGKLMFEFLEQLL